MMSRLRYRAYLSLSARCAEDVAGYADHTVAVPDKVRQSEVPAIGGFGVGTRRKLPALVTGFKRARLRKSVILAGWTPDP